MRGGDTPPRSMRAIRLHGRRDVRVDTVDTPTAGPGQALVRVAASGICGSDLRAIEQGPGRGLRGPIVLGHEFAGIVEVSSDVRQWPPGARVVIDPVIACGTCRDCGAGRTNHCERMRICGFDHPGGLAEYAAVPLASLIRVPERVPLRDAALIEPLSCALHAVRRARDVESRTVVVVGGGMMGLGTAAVALALGAGPVVVCEPSPIRRKAAGAHGATAVVDPAAPGAVEAVHEIVGPTGAEIVVEASGRQAGLRFAVACAGRCASLVVVAAHAGTVQIDAGTAFSKELSLAWSLGALRHDFSCVVDMLQQGVVGPGTWTEQRPLSAISGVLFDELASGTSLKAVIRFGGDEEHPSGG